MSERYWRHTGCDRTIISLFIKLVLPIPISPLMSVFLHILHFSVPIMEWSIEKVEINLSPELYYSLAFVGFCAPNTSTAVISIDFLALFSFWNLSLLSRFWSALYPPDILGIAWFQWIRFIIFLSLGVKSSLMLIPMKSGLPLRLDKELITFSSPLSLLN